MSATRIAPRYAKALFDLSQENSQLEAVKNDMNDFIAAIANSSEFAAVLKSPIVHSDKKVKILDAIFGSSFNNITSGFMKLIIHKGREMYLPEIAKEFMYQYRQFKGIVTVNIKSAVPFSQEALNNIVNKLKSTGVIKGEAEVENELDPDVVGGFIMELDHKVYDASVDYKLDQLRRAFSENLYQAKV